MVNVLDHGADNTGATDTTSAINAAIAELFDNGGTGGIVYFPPGTYQAANIQLRSNVRLTGDDRGSTVIKLKAYASSPQPLIKSQTAGIENVCIEHVTLDGNRANVSGTGDGNAMCVRLDGWSRAVLRDLTIRNAWTDGIYITSTDGSGSGAPSTNITIEDVDVEDCRRTNVGMVFGDGIYFVRCGFRRGGSTAGAQSGTSPKAGMVIEPDAQGMRAKNVTLTSCVFENNLLNGFQAYNAAEDLAVTNLVIAPDCLFLFNGDWAVKIYNSVNETQYVTVGGIYEGNVSGNVFFQNVHRGIVENFAMRQGSAANTGIRLEADCSDCVIGSGAVGTGTAGTALDIAASSVVDTRVSSAVRVVSGAVTDAGTRTRFGGKLFGTRSIDIGSISAGASTTFTITVTGTSTSDDCCVTPPNNLPAGVVFVAYASATDTVTVQATNVTSGAIDPPTGTWRASTWRRT